MLPALLASLRPRQWTKNLLVLAPLVFAHKLDDPATLGRALAAFVVFCILSGAVYLLNDLRDLEQDRLHPVKSKRPLASGRLSRTVARVALALLLVAGVAASWALGPELLSEVAAVHPNLSDPGAGPATVRQPSFFALALTYLLMQVGYSLHLKHVVIVDVMLIAMGFVIRAVAGAAAVAAEISPWLLVCTIFLALFLALAKRRHEVVLLAADAGNHRPTLDEYDPYLLDQMIGIVGAACVISYALYTMAAETVAKFGTSNLNLTLPFVVYGIFRYLYLVHRKADGGDPSASLLADRPLLLAVCLWGVAVVAILYL